MNADRPLLRLERVQASYDGHIVLSDVNLSIGPRDFVGVVGPNGGGKTTLVRLLLGLMRPTAGTIERYSHNRRVERLRVGYLPQQNRQDRRFPITVHEVVLSGFAHPLVGSISAEQAERACHVEQELDLEELTHRPLGELSGGQMQRTLLARAIVDRPELLVLDEPGTYIDARSEHRLYELLEQMAGHTAIVLVSHELDMVHAHARRIVRVERTVTELPHNNRNAYFCKS